MKIEILNWLGLPWKENYGGVKRIRGNEPIGVATHIWLEISQGNSLCSYLYLKQAKTSCFSLYLFSST
jgi:hypothetical protein